MSIVLLIVLIILCFIWLVLGSMPAERLPLSSFELKRRAHAGDREAIVLLERSRNRPIIHSFFSTIFAFLSVIIVLLLIAFFGWIGGIIIALFGAILFPRLITLLAFQSFAHKFFQRSEATIIKWQKAAPFVFQLIKRQDEWEQVTLPQVNSIEELKEVIEKSEGVIPTPLKKRLLHGLQFDHRKVKEVMVRREHIAFIQKKEVLGPLVLDELHKKGHQRFPVVDGTIDRVVGILAIDDLLALRSHHTVTAEKAMNGTVVYVRQDDHLMDILVRFIETNSPFLLVKNNDHETVGLISLEDVIETLLGAPLVPTKPALVSSEN